MKNLPGVYQFVNGDVTVNEMKDVAIEDLLGREAVQVDLEKIFDSLITEMEEKEVVVGIDLGTTNLAAIEGVGIGQGISTTTVKKAIDLGTNVLPPVGGTVDLGTLQLGAGGAGGFGAGAGAGGASFGVDGPGFGSASVGYGTTSMAGAGGAALGTLTTTTTTSTTGAGAAGFGVEGPGLGAGESAVGYGTTSVAGASGMGALTTSTTAGGFGVEGPGLGAGESAVGYGTTSVAGAGSAAMGGDQQTTTTTTTTTTTNFDGNNLVSTLKPDFLPGAFDSTVQNPNDLLNQPLPA